jgi:hypothetical protein
MTHEQDERTQKKKPIPRKREGQEARNGQSTIPRRFSTNKKKNTSREIGLGRHEEEGEGDFAIQDVVGTDAAHFCLMPIPGREGVQETKIGDLFKYDK